jgi:hypothetical protein
VEPSDSRRAWHLIEAVNAVTYFSGECREGPKDIGLQGFWMGYFANRAAPMGAVSPGVVEATFHNFHPEMVRRSIPDAWAFATPEQVIKARSEAAATALRRLAPEVDQLVSRLFPLLRKPIEIANGGGRPLFSANRDVTADPNPEGIWQSTTTLREHRGDGHIAVLTEADLDGCEVDVLLSITEGVPPALLQAGRGWSEVDWSHATDRLRSRGLIGSDGEPTAAGRQLHLDIEVRTDELALRPYSGMKADEFEEMIQLLGAIGQAVYASGEIAFPNPMGLPDPNPTG